MPFLAAVVAILTILLLILLATCAHILARVIRLEQAERARSASEIIPGVADLRIGSQLPPDVLRDLGAHPEQELVLHVVSAGCSGCGAFIDSLKRRDPGRGDRGAPHVVVGHEADRSLLPELGGSVSVSGALVQSAIVSGWDLPVTVRVQDETVVGIERVGAAHP